jgi:hypothetical protein
MNKKDDDFDFPDRPVAPIPTVTVQAEDLKLGPAVVKPFGKSWTEQYGPQPPTAGMRAMDFLILGLFFGTVLVVIKACAWALFS